ncbi:MAG TPA: LysM peptidoglycan-binding domain-containing protein [Lapillicoccus sp.]|nr:LysM peptidoglycan-binding domain-containing protein [Lapillicoccus sp.]
MSAALALDPAVQPVQPGRWLPTSRPRLRLVPTGPEGESAPRSVRLSRRGRLVRTGAVVAISVALGWTVVSTVAAGALPPVHTVTVESGQTLSSIAARELPGLPVREGVAQIQLANGLSSSDVHVGQILQIPARG